MAIYFFSVPLIKRTVYTNQEEAAKTILDNVYELVKSEHLSIEAYGELALEAHKKQLKNIILIQETLLKDKYEKYKKGIMTEEDAASSPMKHILTRTLGSSEDVDAEVFEIEPSEHDRFVLCTDGITDLIKDEEILSMTQEEESPESLCQQFIDTVLDRGAHDNATVISVFLSGEGDRRRGTLGKIGGSMASLLRGKPKSSTKTGG